MKNERLTRTMLMAVVGLALFGAIRPQSPDPVEDSGSLKTWFFVNKTHQDPVYGGVVIGDSRALRGVSADILSEELDGRPVFNFSFHAGGMNDEMFGEAEALLAAGTKDPVVIFAPTALSFLPSKAGNAQFHEYRAKPRDQVWIYDRWPALAHWFNPVVISVPVRKLVGDRPHVRFQQDFRADGWIATDQTPPDDVTNLNIHGDRLIGRQVDPRYIGEFMGRTRDWTARGFKVFGFFPPAYAPRVAQEDSMLGFDRDSFVSDFRAAGGVWLDVDENGYRTYDGSHLVRSSAEKLSRDLARAMVPHL